MRATTIVHAECTTALGLRDELIADLTSRHMAENAKWSSARKNSERTFRAARMSLLLDLIEFWKAVQIEPHA